MTFRGSRSAPSVTVAMSLIEEVRFASDSPLEGDQSANSCASPATSKIPNRTRRKCRGSAQPHVLTGMAGFSLIEHPKGRALFDTGLHPDCQRDPAG